MPSNHPSGTFARELEDYLTAAAQGSMRNPLNNDLMSSAAVVKLGPPNGRPNFSMGKEIATENIRKDQLAHCFCPRGGRRPDQLTKLCYLGQEVCQKP